MRTISALFVGVLYSWLFAQSSALAKEIQLGIEFHGIPEAHQVDEWNSSSPSLHYRFVMKDPRAWDLRPLLELLNARVLEIETTHYPGEDTRAVWSELAKKFSLHFICKGIGLPTPREVRTLNEIGIQKLTVFLSSYPQPGQGLVFRSFKGQLTVHFQAPHYPLRENKSFFREIPERTTFVFEQDYLPGKYHVEVFEDSPQSKILDIQEIYPTEAQTSLLKELRNLQTVKIKSNAPAYRKTTWEELSPISTEWKTDSWIPSKKSLDLFHGKLKITSNHKINQALQEWFRSLPHEVQWTQRIIPHSTGNLKKSAPFLWSLWEERAE